MTTIGINTLVYMDALRNGTPQSELLATIAAHGITLAEVRREYIADDAEYDAIANAAARNLTLSIENDQTPHNGTFACTQASLDHITANGSTIGYTFDLGNWYWRDENAQQAFNRLVDYITVFHLKNVNGSQDKSQLATTMLQDGVIDWQPMLDRLSASIPVFLEFPIPAEQVAEQVDIVRHAIAHS